ncbi:Protein of unknown function [Pyronema omphalodes CBS 100304]|uniref:Uncharacterized protein n=1 Tax=Pyronema omphalodes (strain CBS 100304) TaxID=1076935 RepID=U4KYB5_PYROM|nr:Protein of unknown function [Pyronema omphalodes CBS 100304]
MDGKMATGNGIHINCSLPHHHNLGLHSIVMADECVNLRLEVFPRESSTALRYGYRRFRYLQATMRM